MNNGAVGRVGVPHCGAMPAGQQTFHGNLTVAGGPAPVRAYTNELLPDAMEGWTEPGRVFDSAVALNGVPDGNHAMSERRSLRVPVRP